MKILAIETSCDETACAVIEDGRRVRSSIVASQIEEHRLYGGVVPEIASRRHCESITGVCREALAAAEVTLNDIDAVAVTCAPGLIGALLVGVNFAKGIAVALGKPLIPVHHIRGHIASLYLSHPDLQPPFAALVASGGHTSVIRVSGYTDFEVIGTTLDDAAGEAFDKAARAMGLPYPGGVYIDREARDGDFTRYKLPRPKTGNPYDFSFSGLKTAAVNMIHNAGQKGEKINVPDLAASFQHTVCEILVSKLTAAARSVSCNTLAVCGGVAANSCLRTMLPSALYPAPEYCGDNAAMIGCQAYYELQAGNTADSSLNAYATLEIRN
jgi:N6-L-threonylcarbamoyladenine synthase